MRTLREVSYNGHFALFLNQLSTSRDAGVLTYIPVDDEFELNGGEDEREGEGEPELGFVRLHAKSGEREGIDEVEHDEDVPVEVVRSSRCLADAREGRVGFGG